MCGGCAAVALRRWGRGDTVPSLLSSSSTRCLVRMVAHSVQPRQLLAEAAEAAESAAAAAAAAEAEAAVCAHSPCATPVAAPQQR